MELFIVSPLKGHINLVNSESTIKAELIEYYVENFLRQSVLPYN